MRTTRHALKVCELDTTLRGNLRFLLLMSSSLVLSGTALVGLLAWLS